MNKRTVWKHRILYLLGWALVVGVAGSACSQTGQAPFDYVNPLIGTGAATTESALQHSTAGSEPKGQTFPAVGVPFGMTNWTPQTRASEQKCISPYYYSDSLFQGFRGSHWMSGSCTQDYGSVTVMPMAGGLKVAPDEWASRFDHATETATPAFYGVTLDDYHIRAEATATNRSGVLQFVFQDTAGTYIAVQPNSDEQVGYVAVYPEQQAIVGYNPAHRIYQGWGEPAGFSGYFVALFDRPFQAYGTWQGATVRTDSTTARGNGVAPVGAFARFNIQPGDTVRVMVGTSFTGIRKALANLDAEVPDWRFNNIRAQARDAWEKELARVEIAGGSAAEQEIFYSALYHTMILPRTFSDHDGTYPGFNGDSLVHEASGFTYYADYSMWDTFRAVHPLFTILQPERTRDMIRSLILKAEQGDWLPIFPCWDNYTAAMIGDHAVSPIVDAYMKGITDFDVDQAYHYMIQNATRMPPFQAYVDGKGRRALDSYMEFGYIPLEDSVKQAFHQREQVSRTLEYAYDDFVVAQLAKSLGRADDYQMLIKRAENYKNVFDTQTGFVRGRHADGSWITPFDPAKSQPYITEGTPWQYTWYVPQDVQGLVDLMGGRAPFIAKLDRLFEQGYYWHGNEPSHQIAYLYDYAGAPWKTQDQVRKIMRIEYGTGPGGLSGNEDAGQMSAWYVFSALGMYPVCPGVPYYALGSPLFETAKIRVGEDRYFTIRAEDVSGENRYIQSATLNGKPFTRPWIKHAELTAGGELVLQMGATPKKEWGSASGEAPPSLTPVEKP